MQIATEIHREICEPNIVFQNLNEKQISLNRKRHLQFHRFGQQGSVITGSSNGNSFSGGNTANIPIGTSLSFGNNGLSTYSSSSNGFSSSSNTNGFSNTNGNSFSTNNNGGKHITIFMHTACEKVTVYTLTAKYNGQFGLEQITLSLVCPYTHGSYLDKYLVGT